MTGILKRETLRSWRSTVNKFNHHPSVARERQLIDSHLNALDRIAQLELQAQELELQVEELEKDSPDRLREIIRTHIHRIDDQVGIIALSNERIAHLETEVENLDLEADELRNDRASLESDIEELEEERDEALHVADNLERQVAQLGAERCDYQCPRCATGEVPSRAAQWEARHAERGRALDAIQEVLMTSGLAIQFPRRLAAAIYDAQPLRCDFDCDPCRE